MKLNAFAAVTGLAVCFSLGVLSAHAGQVATPNPDDGDRGYLEIDCNMANVDLHVCPRDRFERITVRKFFGLLTSYRMSCSGKNTFIGTTPLKPVELAEGDYVIMIPTGYVWEHEEPIEVGIAAGQKTFLPLKLFRRQNARGIGEYAGPGGAPSGSGGSGSGGGPGSPPP